MSNLFSSLFHKDRRVCKIDFWLIYMLSVVFNFHGLLVAYSNSSYMEQFASPEAIGALYTISSAIAVLAFLFISRVLKRIGNVRLTLWLAIIEMASLIVLGLTTSPATAVVAFVFFLTLNPLIYLTIDIFSETLIGNNESSTGSKRGFTLTLMSLAAAAGPLAMGLIIGQGETGLSQVYFVSAGVFTVFIMIILTRFYCFTDPSYKEIKVLSAISDFWHKHDIRSVFLAHLTMQVFFSWAVIYVPLYLYSYMGFDWKAIGSIMAVALMAYVIFEWPIGLLADKYFGEKEMMAIGFVILAITSAGISFMTDTSIVSWMILMFVSRIGASLVEATTESYFFKHINGSDANIMSFFRLTRPLGMLIGALLGSVTLLYLPFELIFVVLGCMMIPGIFFTAALHDTK